jgi:hypothetical protein
MVVFAKRSLLAVASRRPGRGGFVDTSRRFSHDEFGLEADVVGIELAPRGWMCKIWQQLYSFGWNGAQ